MNTANLPPQPGETTWAFIEELKAPLWPRHNWTPRVTRFQPKNAAWSAHFHATA